MRALGSVLKRLGSSWRLLEAPWKPLVALRMRLGGLQSRILDTLCISHGYRGGTGTEGTGAGGANNVLLGPGGEDYRWGEQHLSTSWIDS